MALKAGLELAFQCLSGGKHGKKRQLADGGGAHLWSCTFQLRIETLYYVYKKLV
jgi:hypothetical protein